MNIFQYYCEIRSNFDIAMIFFFFMLVKTSISVCVSGDVLPHSVNKNNARLSLQPESPPKYKIQQPFGRDSNMGLQETRLGCKPLQSTVLHSTLHDSACRHVSPDIWRVAILICVVSIHRLKTTLASSEHCHCIYL